MWKQDTSWQYQTLPLSSQMLQRESGARKVWYMVLIAALGIISFLAGRGSMVIRYRDINGHDSATNVVALPTVCGTTVAEAKDANCTFDYLAHLWLPSECATTEYQDQYALYDEQKQPFEYFLHPEDVSRSQTPIDISLLPPGSVVYSKGKEHLAHCAFTLLRTKEWMTRGGAWEPKVLDAHHFEHCVLTLLNATRYDPHWETVGAVAKLGFSGQCHIRAHMESLP